MGHAFRDPAFHHRLLRQAAEPVRLRMNNVRWQGYDHDGAGCQNTKNVIGVHIWWFLRTRIYHVGCTFATVVR